MSVGRVQSTRQTSSEKSSACFLLAAVLGKCRAKVVIKRKGPRKVRNVMVFNKQTYFIKKVKFNTPSALLKERCVFIHTLYHNFTPQVCNNTHLWTCKIAHLYFTQRLHTYISSLGNCRRSRVRG